MRSKQLNNNGFAHIGLVVAVLALVVVGGTGAYVYHANNKAKPAATTTTNQTPTPAQTKSNNPAPNTSFKLPNDWEWYINTNYGFKIAHPASWGQPFVGIIPGDVGTGFNITFNPPPKYRGAMSYNSRTPIELLFQTDNFSQHTCNDAGCRTVTASPTKSSIQDDLSSIADGSYNDSAKGKLLAHDATSYDTINTQLPNGSDTNDLLVERKIVALTHSKISGVYISYGIVNAPTSCNPNALSANSQKLCLNQNDFDIVTKLADSIEPN